MTDPATALAHFEAKLLFETDASDVHAAQQAGERFVFVARLGYSVKEMIGGFEYWAREGLGIVTDAGIERRPVDPLCGPVGAISCAC